MIHEAPKTESQIKMARIWSEVLHIETIGLKDNFFEIGGDSFDATRVLSRLKAEMGVDLSFRVLLDQPILERFSYYLEK